MNEKLIKFELHIPAEAMRILGQLEMVARAYLERDFEFDREQTEVNRSNWGDKGSIAFKPRAGAPK